MSKEQPETPKPPMARPMDIQLLARIDRLLSQAPEQDRRRILAWLDSKYNVLAQREAE
jgi:hypothetical protein